MRISQVLPWLDAHGVAIVSALAAIVAAWKLVPAPTRARIELAFPRVGQLGKSRVLYYRATANAADDVFARELSPDGAVGARLTVACCVNKIAQDSGPLLLPPGIDGGTLGAIVAAIAAVGTTLALPGIGLVVAGPLAAAIAGAGAGAASGGVIGALIGWNIPEERVKHYEQGIQEGGILLGMRTRNDEDATYLENEWKQNRGEHVYR